MSTLQTRINSYAHELDRRRTTVFDVYADEQADHIILSGEVLDRHEHQAVFTIVQHYLEAPKTIIDQLVILREQPDFGYGVVRFGILDVRLEPSRGAELVTEASYGEAVEIVRRADDWVFVRLSDGYLGWVRENGVLHQREPSHYRTGATHVVARRFEPVMSLRGNQIGLLPWSVRLPVNEFRDGKAFFAAPDGMLCFMDADALIPIEDVPSHDVHGLHELTTLVQQFIGVPYLWGGTSVFGFDCSGFAQAVYRFIGFNIPRDADQQAQQGLAIARDQIQAGDLIFWAVERDAEDFRLQKVNHVSIALDAEHMIHASQYRWSVSIEPIEDVQQRYIDNNDPGIVWIRRMID